MKKKEKAKKAAPMKKRAPNAATPPAPPAPAGGNRVQIEFTKTGAWHDALTVTLHGEGPNPVFELKSSKKPAGRIDRTIDLAGPAGTMSDDDIV